jgi:hypothetical protein
VTVFWWKQFSKTIENTRNSWSYLTFVTRGDRFLLTTPRALTRWRSWCAAECFCCTVLPDDAHGSSICSNDNCEVAPTVLDRLNAGRYCISHAPCPAARVNRSAVHDPRDKWK